MLVFKLVGVFLIFLVCSVWGVLKGLSVKMRYKKLLLFCGGLDTLYECINGGETELDKAIKKSFVKCGFINFKSGGFICCDNDLTLEDTTLINDFFAALGHSAKKAECDRIKAFTANVKGRLKEAETETAQKCKIYQTFGVCVGLLLGILLV